MSFVLPRYRHRRKTCGSCPHRSRRSRTICLRHRLALTEAAELNWRVGERIGPDRLGLWISLRLSGVQEEAATLARVGWAVRRLTGGPGPEAGLADFLGRREPENLVQDAESLADRVGGWLELLEAPRDLHPVTRACMEFYLWSLAGLGQNDDRLETAVTAGRIAAGGGKGAVLAPLAMDRAGGLRAGGRPPGGLAAGLPGWTPQS